MNPSAFAEVHKFARLLRVGGERFLLKYVDVALGCRPNHRAADVMWHRDDDEIKVFGLEHLMEVGITLLVTTVHSLQIVDEPLPETEHDFRVDVIVTPEEIITCESPQRPRGLIWEHLNPEKIAAIPILAARARDHHP